MAVQIGSLASNPAVPPHWYNVADYGAVGDAGHDDTSAIAAALTALRASMNSGTTTAGGQTLYFPPGLFKVTSTLDFSGLEQVRILGGSGRGTWDATNDFWPACAIYWTSGGGGNVVNLANTNGIVMDGLSVMAAGTSFTGVLVNMDSTLGDLFGNRLQNLVLKSNASGSCTLLTGKKQIEASFDNVVFGGAGSGGAGTQVRGCTGGTDWFNANTFRNCSFIGARSYSVLNPSTATAFFGCTFEAASGIAAPVSIQARGQSGCDSISFTGCGFWDAAAGSAPWVSSTVATEAFAFCGCHFDQGSTGPAISLSSHQGLVVSGCFFNSLSGGTPNVFDSGHNITNGSMLGCYVKSPVVDNHASVFV